MQEKITETINNIKNSFQEEKDEIQQQIFSLQEKLSTIDEKEEKEIFQLGKSINLSDIDMHYQHYEYFPFLIEGYILENGINSKHINEHDLNIIVHGFNLPENKKEVSQKIKESFFNLTEKEQFYFATFFPMYFQYKNIYMGDFPLVASSHFSWLVDFIFEKYSLVLLPAIHSYQDREKFDNICNNSMFSATQIEKVVDISKPYNKISNTKKHILINLNNNSLDNVEKTKDFIQHFKNLGYELHFETHFKYGDTISFNKLKEIFGEEFLNLNSKKDII